MAAIPSDLAFGKALSSVNIRRLPVRQSTDTQSYGASGKVTLVLPNDFYDGRGGYLSFFAQLGLNGGTYAAFEYPIQSMFVHAQVYLGSTLLEDIDQSSILFGIFKEASSYSSVANLGNEGYYDYATRKAQSIAGRQYQVHLRLESLQQVIPLHKLKLPLRLVLTIGDISSFTTYDGGVPTFTISNIFWNYNIIQPDPAVDAVVDSQIASGNLKIRYHTMDNYNTVVGSATSQTLLLPFKRKCVNSVLAVWRHTTDVNNVLVDGKFVDKYGNLGNIGGYLKVLNTLYPADKYDYNFNFGYLTLSQTFNQVMEPFFYAHERQQDTFSAQTIANRVVAAFDLRRDNSPQAAHLWDNGIDTSGSANSQSLNFTYNALTLGLEYQVFAIYESAYSILPNGNILLDN